MRVWKDAKDKAKLGARVADAGHGAPKDDGPRQGNRFEKEEVGP